MNDIYPIVSGSLTLAYFVGRKHSPETTHFITPPEASMQVGAIVYPAGGKILPHIHISVPRRVQQTAEMLFVKKGKCEISLYDPKGKFVEKKVMRTGDAILLLAGGHGFKMLQDTTLIEVKQGPYAGVDEKKYIR